MCRRLGRAERFWHEDGAAVVVDLLQGAADADASAVLSVSNVQYAVGSGAASSTPPAGVSLTGASLSVDPTDPSFDSIAQARTASSR